MRLNRYLARAGVTSRRGADRLIAAGRVSVNGVTVGKLGTEVEPGRDSVRVDGRGVALPLAYTYIILNKPPGVVVTMSDPGGRPTVAGLVAGAGARVVPVGRLDAATRGLLLLTDDGEIAYRVAHPSFELTKVYEVSAEGALEEKARRLLESGVEIDGRVTSPARVRVLAVKDGSTFAEISLHEGRKRQVRRMFEAVGHAVTDLRRVRIGPLGIGDLPEGCWRPLSACELSSLRAAVGLPEEGEMPCRIPEDGL